MNLRISIQVPDSYELKPEHLKIMIQNSLWWYARGLDDEENTPTKTFNTEVKVFVADEKDFV